MKEAKNKKHLFIANVAAPAVQGWMGGGGHCMKGISHNVEADERVSGAVNNMSNRE